MSLRRIGDIPPEKFWGIARTVPCFDPEHNPSQYFLLEPGIYEHICPSCGKKTTFSVYPNNNIFMGDHSKISGGER